MNFWGNNVLDDLTVERPPSPNLGANAGHSLRSADRPTAPSAHRPTGSSSRQHHQAPPPTLSSSSRHGGSSSSGSRHSTHPAPSRRAAGGAVAAGSSAARHSSHSSQPRLAAPPPPTRRAPPTAATAASKPKQRKIMKTCEKCSQVVRSTDMARHMRKFHSGNPTILCRDCGATFNNLHQQTIHYHKVHNKLPPTGQNGTPGAGPSGTNTVRRVLPCAKARCCHCNQLFPTRKRRKIHFEKEHPDKHVFPCTKGRCTAEFATKAGVLAHMATCVPGRL